ncbi:CHAT domain-containing protein [Sorangium sp. So ce1099]|uniref:CHAT domain-containing protein n=1 Tax=Sorangium sp. So ce1099 TaxID=3133331 RepID=UPI003F6156DD
MQKQGLSGVWMEVELARDGAQLRVRARGSREESTSAHRLAPQLTADIHRFAAEVRGAAGRGRPLGSSLATAHELHGALLRDEIATLRARLHEAAGGEPVLLRLAISDADLKAVPWEALCEPSSAMGFWGSSPDLLPARSVTTNEPWQPREVRGAVKVLAVAPSGGATLARLEGALGERIASGEVAWREPLVGSAANLDLLRERLRVESPHVLHFLGHGRVRDGIPEIQLADAHGEEQWLPAELLGQDLKASLRGDLRLIVLEACKGAQPGAFASAAETLARSGADAVIGHLWPVDAEVARCCSEQLYRALAGRDQGRGDVARSLNQARWAILAAFDGSAEAFSPVLYLRAPRAALFDFAGRSVVEPQAAVPARGGARAVDPALERLRRRPFSLVLGDRLKSERPALDGFRDRLLKEVDRPPGAAPPGLPMSALAQRFALRCGADTLEAEFQHAFRAAAAIPPLFAALAQSLGPGVHTTLIRTPVLEQALAEHQADRRIYAIQPDRESTVVLLREAGGARWARLAGHSPSIDPEEDIVVLRLYRGFRPDEAFSPPLLTEDDYLLGFRELEKALPPESADDILDALATEPALLMGLSLHLWDHRMLLYRLFGKRPLPRRSLAVVEPEDGERELWEKGTSLPGKEGVAVIEASAEELGAWLGAGANGGRR